MYTSLIIPTYNKMHRLNFLLKSLLLLEGKDTFEVIIVNDGSTDNTEHMLNKFISDANKTGLFVKVVKTKNGGRSVARNCGVNEAKGELLVFTDDDIVLSPRFIRAHQEVHKPDFCQVVRGVIYNLPFLKFFKNPETGELFEPGQRVGNGIQKYLLDNASIEPSLKKIRSQARLAKFEKDIHKLYLITPENHKLRWVGCTGGNFSVRKKDFEKVGAFDTGMGKIWGCEDLEFGYRMKKSGAPFVIANQAENFHISHFRVNSRSEHEQAMAYFFSKHKDEAIMKLNEYFGGKLQTLEDWKSHME